MTDAERRKLDIQLEYEELNKVLGHEVHICHILASLVEGFYPPCHCSVRKCRFPRKPLEDLDDTVVLYDLWHTQSLSNSVVPVSKQNDNTTLDLQLTRGSILFVSSHARDVGRESPFAPR
ncbi:hypothetical protein AVEN_251201-1 [Araneus ventricosus]|uniref:Uncharacterized protein n=1 Tax=Araneus ventricosus TaxID=182803 RepID=A0A4Y2MW62_ARAVE|nr:hypothetical protein AVEN_251201-1 [Araneus ventricosus]